MFDVTVGQPTTGRSRPSSAAGARCLVRAAACAPAFFVIGNELLSRDARAWPERAHAEGHWIGNHTWTHSRPLGGRPGAAAADLEIGRTQAEIGVLSHSDRLFRPTGGGGHLWTAGAEPRRGGAARGRRLHACVLWNAIPRDWADPDGWVRDRARAAARGGPWTLMVLHDLPSGAMRRPRPLPGRGEGARRPLAAGLPRLVLAPSPADGSPGRSRISSASPSERSSDGTAPLGSHEASVGNEQCIEARARRAAICSQWWGDLHCLQLDDVAELVLMRAIASATWEPASS